MQFFFFIRIDQYEVNSIYSKIIIFYNIVNIFIYV